MSGDRNLGMPAGGDDGASMRRTYALVIVVEVITLVGLWVFQTWFGV